MTSTSNTVVIGLESLIRKALMAGLVSLQYYGGYTVFDDDDIVLELFESGYINTDLFIDDAYHIDNDDTSVYDDGSGLYLNIND